MSLMALTWPIDAGEGSAGGNIVSEGRQLYYVRKIRH